MENRCEGKGRSKVTFTEAQSRSSKSEATRTFLDCRYNNYCTRLIKAWRRRYNLKPAALPTLSPAQIPGPNPQPSVILTSSSWCRRISILPYEGSGVDPRADSSHRRAGPNVAPTDLADPPHSSAGSAASPPPVTERRMLNQGLR
jgi:hypothetical protein